jgi:hypothetical protein
MITPRISGRETTMMRLDHALRSRSKFLQERATPNKDAPDTGGILDRTRVYLSGPMDFVPSREDEKNFGWRTRLGQFLKRHGVTVFDPWNKPEVSGMPHYGKEDEFTIEQRNRWIYKDDANGQRVRNELCEAFWPTLHIDLRMTDLSDFVIAYCPTNVYSVGTVHEIATARLQHKPVLLVTPRIEAPPRWDELRNHLGSRKDAAALQMVDALQAASTDRPNPNGIPSLWYMAMLGNEDYFFDGFGFEPYREQMGWAYYAPLDEREKKYPPQRPLLPYLASLDHAIPTRLDNRTGNPEENPEWLIFVEGDGIERARPDK